jgi:hypothetical protein
MFRTAVYQALMFVLRRTMNTFGLQTALGSHSVSLFTHPINDKKGKSWLALA